VANNNIAWDFWCYHTQYATGVQGESDIPLVAAQARGIGIRLYIMHIVLWSFNLVSKTQQTPCQKFIFHTEKLKDISHGPRWLLYSSRSLSFERPSGCYLDPQVVIGRSLQLLYNFWEPCLSTIILWTQQTHKFCTNSALVHVLHELILWATNC